VFPTVSAYFSDGQDIFRAFLQRRIVTVKACNDLNSEILEAVIIKKRSAKLSRAYQNCVCQPLTSEMAFNVGNQFIGFVADLRLSRTANRRKILTNLNVAER